MNDLTSIREFLESLARKAGKIMIDHWQQEIEVFRKPDRTPVTEVDLKISKLVLSEIASAFPDCGVITEESYDKNVPRAANGFIVDELDGTSAYIRGKRGFTFQCAYYEDYNRLLLGLIYDPLEDRLVYAIKDLGVCISQMGTESKLLPPEQRTWLKLRYANHRQYMTQTLRKMYAKLGVSAQNIIPTGGIGSKSLDFATGKVDVLIALNRKIAVWDWAPGKVILEELGYSISHLTGEPVLLTQNPAQEGFGYLVCPPYFREKFLGELNWIVRKFQRKEVGIKW